ncbi:MAG: hypothetical protein JO246_12235 [Frankiaceae bacterium]|nr:hypothetical protein [Frankiaceae bacterium]MBV9870251.1 hypothetical protein [Frankiaceae bacterium]
MRRAVLVALAVGIAASGIGVATAGAGKKLDIPTVKRIALVYRHGNPSGVERGSIRGKTARRIVRSLDELTPYPKHTGFGCTVSPGGIKTAFIHHHRHRWRVQVGSCGRVPFVRTDGGRPRAYHATKTFTASFKRGFALMRPRAEQVPASLRKARVADRKDPTRAWAHRRTVSGRKAADLVKSFNHLDVEPPNSLICNAAGGPEQKVVFTTSAHRWLVIQAPCSEVQVQRDGKSLPTLLSDKAWAKALEAALGT